MTATYRADEDAPVPQPAAPARTVAEGRPGMLTILGRSHNGETIWFDAGHGEQELDESQILTLLAAFNAPHPLYPLVQCFCGDADAVQFIDGRAYCHGHAQAFTYAEEGL